MEFSLLGKNIEISDGKINYVKIIADFRAMAKRASSYFNGDVADYLLEHYEENALNHYYDDFVAETRKYLAKYGVYTLSDDEISQKLTSNKSGFDRNKTFLQREFDASFEKIAESAPYYESEDARTNYIVKKSLDLLNTGYFNNEIEADIMALCDFSIEYLSDNEVIELQVVYQDDSDKAKAIYENLITGNIPEHEKSAFAASLIELDFSEEDYYTFVFNTFPQARFEIAQIAKHLGVDISGLIDVEINRTFDVKKIASEEDALKMMDELMMTMEKFCVTSSSRKTELDKILHDFDIKAKTYDGVQYATRELRNKA